MREKIVECLKTSASGLRVIEISQEIGIDTDKLMPALAGLVLEGILTKDKAMRYKLTSTSSSKVKKIYRTPDGKEFDTEDEAEKHAAKEGNKLFMDQFLADSDFRCKKAAKKLLLEWEEFKTS